jgi:hypothetical protein
MAAISAIAEVPGRVDHIFISDELSPVGVYGIRTYMLGVPTTTIVDDYIPMSQWGHPLFANVSRWDGSVWVSILEKAFAKTFGNYHRTEGGTHLEGSWPLNGSPAWNIHHGSVDEA